MDVRSIPQPAPVQTPIPEQLTVQIPNVASLSQPPSEPTSPRKVAPSGPLATPGGTFAFPSRAITKMPGQVHEGHPGTHVHGKHFYLPSPPHVLTNFFFSIKLLTNFFFLLS